jgi:hypothetical protein
LTVDARKKQQTNQNPKLKQKTAFTCKYCKISAISPRQQAVPVRAAASAQSTNKLPPAMQWRQNNRLMDEDNRSTSTRSMLDEDEDENLIVDVENTDQPAGSGGMYVPNFEV